MTRRELLALAASAPLLRAAAAPTAPVAIARCSSYNEDVTSIMATMFDQIGGAERLARNKTVTIKLNLTGSPGLRFQGKALGSTHYTHPKTVAAMCTLLSNAGAKRIRLVESAWATTGPLEEYLLDSGWNVRALRSAVPIVEFVNTNGRGSYKNYARLRTPGSGLIFPAYELNRSYVDTDVFVSMAKLKNHDTCGVTLSMKNCFGITPASIYGDDAGVDDPNEKPTAGRVNVCHLGKRAPAKAALPELNPASSREPGYRMPRITAELAATRPIDLAFIDGVETVAGGEGPWVSGLRSVKPGILLMGTNPTCTDTVATSAMGYDPRAPKGQGAFVKCDNTLLLAESLGVGSADLSKIEVPGLPLQEARFRFSS